MFFLLPSFIELLSLLLLLLLLMFWNISSSFTAPYRWCCICTFLHSSLSGEGESFARGKLQRITGLRLSWHLVFQQLHLCQIYCAVQFSCFRGRLCARWDGCEARIIPHSLSKAGTRVRSSAIFSWDSSILMLDEVHKGQVVTDSRWHWPATWKPPPGLAKPQDETAAVSSSASSRTTPILGKGSYKWSSWSLSFVALTGISPLT